MNDVILSIIIQIDKDKDMLAFGIVNQANYKIYTSHDCWRRRLMKLLSVTLPACPGNYKSYYRSLKENKMYAYAPNDLIYSMFIRATLDENFQIANSLLEHARKQLSEDKKIIKYVATIGSSLPVFVFLIENGANINDSLSFALMEFSGRQNQTIPKYLMKYVTNKAVFECAMYRACGYGNTEFIKLLLENGADVNCEGALQEAVDNDRFDTVKLLLERGTDVSTIEDNGVRKSLRIIDLLINNGLNISKYENNILNTLVCDKQSENAFIKIRVFCLCERSCSVQRMCSSMGKKR
jgi:hypothetical protein